MVKERGLRPFTAKTLDGKEIRIRGPITISVYSATQRLEDWSPESIAGETTRTIGQVYEALKYLRERNVLPKPQPKENPTRALVAQGYKDGTLEEMIRDGKVTRAQVRKQLYLLRQDPNSGVEAATAESIHNRRSERQKSEAPLTEYVGLCLAQGMERQAIIDEIFWTTNDHVRKAEVRARRNGEIEKALKRGARGIEKRKKAVLQVLDGKVGEEFLKLLHDGDQICDLEGNFVTFLGSEVVDGKLVARIDHGDWMHQAPMHVFSRNYSMPQYFEEAAQDI